MDIILDTNIIFRMPQRLLESSAIKLIATAQERIGGSILIPQVVIEELVNRYRKDFDACLAEIGDQRRILNKLLLGGCVELAPPVSSADATEQYRVLLLASCATVGAIILDYPAISHSDIALRAIRRRKPFKTNGIGYCDALIWETVLHRCCSSRVVFVTDNASDFMDERKGALHEDLRDDMSRLGADDDAIVICRSLSEAYDNYLCPLQEREASGGPDVDVGSLPQQILCEFWIASHKEIAEQVQETITFTDRQISKIVGQKVFGAQISEVDQNLLKCSIGEGHQYDPPAPNPVFFSPVVEVYVNVEFLIERGSVAAIDLRFARIEEQDPDRDVLVGTVQFVASVTMSLVWDPDAGQVIVGEIERGELVRIETR